MFCHGLIQCLSVYLNIWHSLLNIYTSNGAGRWWNVTWKLSIEFIPCAQAKGERRESAISHLVSIVWYRADNHKGIRLPCIFRARGTTPSFIIYQTFQPPWNWGTRKIHVFFLVKNHQDNNNTQKAIIFVDPCCSRQRGIATRMKSIQGSLTHRWWLPEIQNTLGISKDDQTKHIKYPVHIVRPNTNISSNIHIYWDHRRWWYATNVQP